jgi:protein-S-isoprenylcysteine O-methyltransferase Ste14
MNAIIIILPIFLIRYWLLGRLNREALKRAGFFAPLIGGEKVAYWIYQLITIIMVILLFFIKFKTNTNYFYIGLVVYILGITLYIGSIYNYAKPKSNGITIDGLYQLSRNPMYIAFFVYILGGVLLTHSLILFVLLIIFQVSAHWIILSEERWCMNEFGDEYIKYMKKVRRYF